MEEQSNLSLRITCAEGYRWWASWAAENGLSQARSNNCSSVSWLPPTRRGDMEMDEDDVEKLSNDQIINVRENILNSYIQVYKLNESATNSSPKYFLDKKKNSS